METRCNLSFALACVLLGASCTGSAATTWLPAVGVVTRVGARGTPPARWSLETRLTATWGGGPPLPAPLAHTALAARAEVPPPAATDLPCRTPDACAWERWARALATRAELARLRSRR